MANTAIKALSYKKLKTENASVKTFFLLLATHGVNLHCNISNVKAIADDAERLLPPNMAEFNVQPLSNVLYGEPDQ